MIFLRGLLVLQVLTASSVAFAQYAKDPTSPRQLNITPQGSLSVALVLANGKYVLTGGETHGVQGWLLPSLKSHAAITLESSRVTALAESPDGKWLAFGYLNEDRKLPDQVALWDRSGRKFAWVRPTAHFYPSSLVFTPDSRRLVVGTTGYHYGSGAIFVLSVDGGNEERRLERKTALTARHRPSYVAISPKGDFLASSGSTGEIDVWETEGWTTVRQIKAFSSAVIGLQFAPLDGSLAAFAAEDDNEDGDALKFWSIPECQEVATIYTKAPVECVTFNTAGSLMAIGTRVRSRAVILWDMKTRSSRGALTLSEGYPKGVAFVPNTTHLVAPVSRSIALWDYSWINNDSVAPQILAKQNPNLGRMSKLLADKSDATELTLSDFNRIEDDEDFQHIPKLAKLEILALGHLNIKGRGFKALQTCPKLKTLKLGSARGIDSFEGLGTLTQLETLIIEGCRIRSWSGLEKLTNLRELSITGSWIRGQDLSAMQSLAKLKKLTLDGSWDEVYGQDPHFDGRDLVHLTKLSNLESLSLDGMRIGDAAVPHIKKLTQLRTLDVTGTVITDAIVDAIQRMAKLTEARLGTLSNERLAQLGKHPSLTKLYFDGSLTNSAGLAALGESGSLRELSIGGYWTPYPELKFARDLKQMPPKKIFAYDHIRMLQELASDEDAWESRRQYFAAGGMFVSPMQRDAKGTLIDPLDVRHPQYEQYRAAREEFREAIRDLDDTSIRMGDFRSRSIVLARKLVDEVFADEPERKVQLLEIIKGTERE